MLDTGSIPPAEAAPGKTVSLGISSFWHILELKFYERKSLLKTTPSLSGKESLCPVTLALFQHTFPGLGAAGKKHRKGWGGGGGLLPSCLLLVCLWGKTLRLKEEVTRWRFRRNLCIRDYSREP